MREGRVKSPSGEEMPNVYRENVQLQDRVAQLLDVVETFRGEAHAAHAKVEQLRKERDYHRMHHRRILQDKAGLVSELKRQQQTMQQLQTQNEALTAKRAAALRSKMLATIHRDQAVAQASELQATIQRSAQHALRRSQGDGDMLQHDQENEEEDEEEEDGVQGDEFSQTLRTQQRVEVCCG